MSLISKIDDIERRLTKIEKDWNNIVNISLEVKEIDEWKHYVDKIIKFHELNDLRL